MDQDNSAPEVAAELEINLENETSSKITTASKRFRGGRYNAEKSAVWDHYRSVDGKNQCRYCIYSTTDRNPSNLQKHLKKHPAAFADVEKKISRKRPTAASLTAPKLSPSIGSLTQSKLPVYIGNKPKSYDKESKRYKDLINALALLFAAQSLPHLLIESPEFKNLFLLLDPKFDLPNRRRLSAEIANLSEKVKERILDELSHIDKVCIVLDIWTKKGLSESYLGVLIKYFEPQSAQNKSALLALRKMEGSHNAQNIYKQLQSVLDEWNINHDIISFYVTDNGSSIVKALKECVVEFVPMIQDCDEDEELQAFEEVDPNLDASFIEMESNKDLSEFEKLENEHNMIFGYSKRIACIAHQLMCAVRKCVDKSPILQPVIQAALSLVTAISKSMTNKELLLKLNGRNLLSPSQTRWVYTYYVLNRLIESKEAVEKVTVEKNLFNVALDALKWKQIEQVCDLLKPFALAVNELEGDSYSTLSKVIPNLIDIIENMNDRAGSCANFGTVASELQKELENRFDYILNIENRNFQPAYMTATFLMHEFVVGLSKEQRKACIQFIVQELSQKNISVQNLEMGEATAQSADAPTKFSRFYKKYQQNTIPSVNDRSKLLTMKLESYVEEALASRAYPVSKKIGAQEYWLFQKAVNPEIAIYALNLLAVPASLAGIERVFSLASIVQNRRYRLGAGSTEKELMIKINQMFLIDK